MTGALELHDEQLAEVSHTLASVRGQFAELVQTLDPSLFPRSEWQEIKASLASIDAAVKEIGPAAVSRLRDGGERSVLDQVLLELHGITEALSSRTAAGAGRDDETVGEPASTPADSADASTIGTAVTDPR